VWRYDGVIDSDCGVFAGVMLIFLGISHGTQPSPGKRCEADRRWRVFREIHSKENKIQSAA